MLSDSFCRLNYFIYFFLYLRAYQVLSPLRWNVIYKVDIFF